MQLSDTIGACGGPGPPTTHGAESCRFPKLEECAHFHYERVQLPKLTVKLEKLEEGEMDKSLHSQHTLSSLDGDPADYFTLQVTCREECWLIQRTYENFTMLDAQLHQCIYDRKVSQLPDLSTQNSDILALYLERLCSIIDNSLNCGPILNWFQLDNRGHRLLVPSEESRSINTPAVAAAYSVRKYVSQARDELSLEVGDMISVIDMANPGESVWWRGKRGFQVGFFPQHCVHIIGDKVPRNMPLPPPVVGSLALSPIKPVLRKHGKLITFFRSFILNRPSRRRLKQSGILKERVFGCDLGEHLSNSGHDIPMVLKCCAEFIESHGIVDGIYRLSGVTSNIQKLRNAFDEDRIPNLYTDDILQDIHSVASLLKMYFRELPNPLCTYQLYHSFVVAVQGCSASRNKANDNERLLKMREAVQKLPPPHYRTLEYLMRHLSRIAAHGSRTGMTTRNVAIVWAPNLLRCEELEIGGVAALQGVGVQAVVTEFLVCYADLIFSERIPANLDEGLTRLSNVEREVQVSPKRSRPKSLAISTPTKLLTLEEARNKHLLNKSDDNNYIEVGGGPKTLPKKYHTVIELPPGSRKRGLTKRSPSGGWRSFFSKSRNSSHGNLSKREISSPGIIPIDHSVTESDLNEIKRKLRPVKSAESLTSGHSEPLNCDGDVLGPLYSLQKSSGHNRSVSHDSYFDNLQSSQNNSVGSLLDLSEIQLNFELEESEMRIFSEDESLVSSPKVQKDHVTRKTLSRTRFDDTYSSCTNSSNPSPKKQPRVVLSPDSMSRKRSRLEDQFSDIQYIDCNTPENPCIISTTAQIHNQDDRIKEKNIGYEVFEGYQPKNKSPRNSSDGSNRYSLNFEKIDITAKIPKSLTETDFKQLTPTPQTPNYKPLDSTGTTNTPVLSFSSEDDYDPKTPNYENILTTISIVYKSPVKSRSNSENIYEDIELNPQEAEKAVIPTTAASLPSQEAAQPQLGKKSEQDSLETTFDSSITTIKTQKTQKNDDLGEFEAKYSSSNDNLTEFEAKYSSSNDNLTEFDHKTRKNDGFEAKYSSSNDHLREFEANTSDSLMKKSNKTRKNDGLSDFEPKYSSSNDNLSDFEAKYSPSNDNLREFEANLMKKSPKTSKNDDVNEFEANTSDSLMRNTQINDDFREFEPKKSPIKQTNDDLSDFESNQSDSLMQNYQTTDGLSLSEPNSSKKSLISITNYDLSEFEAKSSDSLMKKPHKTPKNDNLSEFEANQSDSLMKNSQTNDDSSDFGPKKSPKTQINDDLSEFDLKNCQTEDDLSLTESKSSDSSMQKCFKTRKNDFKPKKPQISDDLSPTEVKLMKNCQTQDDSSLSEPNSSKQSITNYDLSDSLMKKSTEVKSNDSLMKNCQTQGDSSLSEPKSSDSSSKKSLISITNDDLSFTGAKSSDSLMKNCQTTDDLSLLEPQSSDNSSKISMTADDLSDFEPQTTTTSSDSSSTKLSSDEIDRSGLSGCTTQLSHLEISDTSPENSSQNKEKPDKRKSCDAELLDENTIYQQVKYFRRSIHEINSLLQEPAPEPDQDEFDSLEPEHVYENVELIEEPSSMNSSMINSSSMKDVRIRMHENTPKKIPEADLMVCGKCSDSGNVRNLTSKFEKPEKIQKPHNYEKDNLPPCLRAKNAKNSIKTRSLDENAFVTEFGASPNLQRRKSLDDRTSSYIDSKLLESSSVSTNNLKITPESGGLNRERIEKYKEERRNYWREKYRSESFKEDKDILLSRLKHKTSKTELTADVLPTADKLNADKLNVDKKTEAPKFNVSERDGAVNKSFRSPHFDRKTSRSSLKELSDKIFVDDGSIDSKDCLMKEEEFLRHRRGDGESERRRHTYDLMRERDDERDRRVSLDNKNHRKEKCSPSYCIKDMKAIFESKSQQ